MHPGMMYPHHHAYRFRRFGVFRRFFWFGAGAAVATWYYNKQQRIAAAESGGIDGHRGWHQAWHARANQQQQPQHQSIPIDHVPASTATASPTMQATLYAPQDSSVPSPSITPAASQAEVNNTNAEGRHWGWRARQRMREQREQQVRAEAAAQTQDGAQQVSTGTASDGTAGSMTQTEQDEMARIREAVDRLYAEKMRDVKSMQEQANEKAKEYARVKIDQLSVALETLRQSLKKEEDFKVTEKKLV